MAYSPPVYSPRKVEEGVATRLSNYGDLYRAAAGQAEEMFVDTGIRLRPRGDLALCSRLGYEQLGVTCGSCKSVSIHVKPWVTCANCGDPMWDVVPGVQQSASYTVDWTTGFLRANPNAVTGKASESATAVSSALKKDAERESPASVAKPERVVVRPKLSYSRVRGPASKEPAVECETPSSENADTRKGESIGMGNGKSVSPSTVVSPVYSAMDMLESDSEQGEEAVASLEENRWQDQGEESVEKPNSFQLPRTGKLIPDQPAIRCEDDFPRPTSAAMRAQMLAKLAFVKKSPDAGVLPGLGNIADMTSLSRHQRIVNKRVAKDFGYDYPYVPEDIMDVIEKNRQSWCEEAVWDYLGIPKANRSKDIAAVYLDKFNSCMDTWGYGRAIYKDRVVMKRPDKPDLVRSTTVMNKEGKLVRVPDPVFYA